MKSLILPANLWIWVTRGSFAAVLVFGVIGALMKFLPGIHEQERAEAKMLVLKEKEQELRVRRDSLRHQKVLLQSDAVFIEEKCRDRLNMKKAGEEIYRFPDASDGPAAAGVQL